MALASSCFALAKPCLSLGQENLTPDSKRRTHVDGQRLKLQWSLRQLKLKEATGKRKNQSEDSITVLEIASCSGSCARRITEVCIIFILKQAHLRKRYRPQAYMDDGNTHDAISVPPLRFRGNFRRRATVKSAPFLSSIQRINCKSQYNAQTRSLWVQRVYDWEFGKCVYISMPVNFVGIRRTAQCSLRSLLIF